MGRPVASARTSAQRGRLVTKLACVHEQHAVVELQDAGSQPVLLEQVDLLAGQGTVVKVALWHSVAQRSAACVSNKTSQHCAP